jgi:hypothetical protein
MLSLPIDDSDFDTLIDEMFLIKLKKYSFARPTPAVAFGDVGGGRLTATSHGSLLVNDKIHASHSIAKHFRLWVISTFGQFPAPSTVEWAC